MWASMVIAALLLLSVALPLNAECPRESVDDQLVNVYLKPSEDDPDVCVRACTERIVSFCEKQRGDQQAVEMNVHGAQGLNMYLTTTSQYGSADYSKLATLDWEANKDIAFLARCQCEGEVLDASIRLNVSTPEDSETFPNQGLLLRAVNVVTKDEVDKKNPVPVFKLFSELNKKESMFAEADPFYLSAQVGTALNQLHAAILDGFIPSTALVPCNASIILSTKGFEGMMNSWTVNETYICDGEEQGDGSCACRPESGQVDPVEPGPVAPFDGECEVCVAIPNSCGQDQPYMCRFLIEELRDTMSEALCVQDCPRPTRRLQEVAEKLLGRRSLRQDIGPDGPTGPTVKICSPSPFGDDSLYNTLADGDELSRLINGQFPAPYTACGFTVEVTDSCKPGTTFAWFNDCALLPGAAP